MRVSFIVGRMQPLHDGHVHIINEAISIADRTIVLIGSSNEYRTTRNPFTFEERSDLVYSVFSDKVTCLPLIDIHSNKSWIEAVEDILFSFTSEEDEIIFVYCDKDNSTLDSNNLLKDKFKLYPVKNSTGLDATNIRKLFYENSIESITGVPEQTIEFLSKFNSIKDIT